MLDTLLVNRRHGLQIQHNQQTRMAEACAESADREPAGFALPDGVAKAGEPRWGDPPTAACRGASLGAAARLLQVDALRGVGGLAGVPLVARSSAVLATADGVRRPRIAARCEYCAEKGVKLPDAGPICCTLRLLWLSAAVVSLTGVAPSDAGRAATLKLIT